MKSNDLIIIFVMMAISVSALATTSEKINNKILEIETVTTEAVSKTETTTMTASYQQVEKPLITKETTKETTAPATSQQVKNPYIKRNLGTFSLTFYVANEQWGYATATGVKSKHLATCAVDPDIIPLGSVIQITGDNGQTLILKCVDVGGGIKGNKIDIFYDGGTQSGYNWMADFGTVQEVYLLEE